LKVIPIGQVALEEENGNTITPVCQCSINTGRDTCPLVGSIAIRQWVSRIKSSGAHIVLPIHATLEEIH
jgi:hypothetical protein